MVFKKSNVTWMLLCDVLLTAVTVNTKHTSPMVKSGCRLERQ